MTTVDVTPDSLNDAGDTLTGTRDDDLVGSADLLHGHGDPEGQFVSLEGFPMGVQCQHRLTQLYGQACEVYQLAYFDLMGLSSVLHIVADLFNVTNQDNALAFAFLQARANIPQSDLPDHLQGWEENNSRALFEQMQIDAALNGDGELPLGYTSDTFPDGQYMMVTEVKDADGNVVARHVVITPPGGPRTVTTRYFDEDGQVIQQEHRNEYANGNWVETSRRNGEVVSKREHTIDADGTASTVTYHVVDGELEPVRADVKEVNDDGSLTFQTLDLTQDEDNQVVTEWGISAQPDARSFQEVNSAFTQQMKDQNALYAGLTENEAYQAYLQSLPSGVTPGENGEIPWEEAREIYFEATDDGWFFWVDEITHHMPLLPEDDHMRDEFYPGVPQPSSD